MSQLVITRWRYLIYFFFLWFILPSCDKVNDSPIPEASFTFTIDLIIENQLNNPNGSAFFPYAGFGGVIIYCEYPGIWYAYDASCTYEASRNCILKLDGALAECPCCSSQFILSAGGYPGKAPATIPLKQYHVSLMNNNTLMIFN